MNVQILLTLLITPVLITLFCTKALAQNVNLTPLAFSNPVATAQQLDSNLDKLFDGVDAINGEGRTQGLGVHGVFDNPVTLTWDAALPANDGSLDLLNPGGSYTYRYQLKFAYGLQPDHSPMAFQLATSTDGITFNTVTNYLEVRAEGNSNVAFDQVTDQGDVQFTYDKLNEDSSIPQKELPIVDHFLTFELDSIVTNFSYTLPARVNDVGPGFGNGNVIIGEISNELLTAIAIPEPSAYALLLGSAAGVALAIRRKRNSL